MKRLTLWIAASVSALIFLNQCKSKEKLNPEQFIAEVKSINDSMKFHSQKWNQSVSVALNENKDYDQLTNERAAFVAYIERAKSKLSHMDEPGKNAKEVKLQYIKFMELNETMLQDLSPFIEKLDQVSSDSIGIYKDKAGMSSIKYGSAIDDAFMKAINYIQLYQMNNHLDPKK